MGLSNNDDAMNKIPLKSVTDDEEKNGGDFIHDTATAEEARREQRRVKLLNLMKKLTIGIICFIGIALISYVIISLCFSDWPKSAAMPQAATATASVKATTSTSTKTTTTTTTTTPPPPSPPSTFTTSPIANTSTTATAVVTNYTNSNSATNTNTPPPAHLSLGSAFQPATPPNTTPLQTQPPLGLAATTTAAVPLIPPSASPLLSLPPSFNSSLLSDDKSPAEPSTSPTDAGAHNATHTASILGGSPSRAPTTAATATTTTTEPPIGITATTGAASNGSGATTTEPGTTLPTTTLEPLLFKDSLNVQKNFTSKLGVYEHAAVCSDKTICSQIGSKILQDGGSAVDSAIATLLCNGLATMHSMGIGGGMLMNVFIKSQKKAYSIDAREVAPYAATPERLQDVNSTDLLHGPLAIAVPGELMGYHIAHERFGKLPWKKLVEPSLQLCKEGFYLTQHQHNALGYKDKHIRNNTVLRKMFYNDTTHSIHPVGTKIFPVPELCNTYQLIADNGAYDFYNGTLAKLVAEDLEEMGSLVDFGDLETYRADLVNSVTMQLGDSIIYAVPPISSGTVVSHVLGILEGYNFTKADTADVKDEATTIHRFVEAMKFGYAKRWELGDARFNDVRELVSRLMDLEHAEEKRKKINDTSALASEFEYGAQFTGEDDVGTSAMVVLAPNGDAVSVTSSVNDYFGSGLAGKRTGIVFNSAMNDFSLPEKTNQFHLPPSPANFIEPQKRPMSSMSPMILADQNGTVQMAISAAGGSKIISALVEVIGRVLWMNQNIKEAIDAPRYHHQLVPNVLQYEKHEYFTEELLKLLSDKMHHLKAYNYTASVVCGIVKNETAIYANADYRKRGGVEGY